MAWFSRRNYLSAEKVAGHHGIEGLWRNLCEVMSDAVHAYQRIYPQERLKTNGGSSSRWVLRRLSDAEGPVRKIEHLEVGLDRHASSISLIRSDGSTTVFQVSTDERGAVRLADEKRVLTVSDLSRIVLEPILFPDLQPPSVKTEGCSD